jgi:hypothetical protein
MQLNNKLEHFNTLKSQSPVFFNLCDNVNAIRYFYTELIGLKETAFKPNSYIEFKIKGKTMMFYQADKIFKRLKSFKHGYINDKNENLSWSLNLEEETFTATVNKLIYADIEILNNEPVWMPDGYWSFSVLDPMGNRLEIFMEPKKSPVSRLWSENFSANKKIARFLYQAILKKLAI